MASRNNVDNSQTAGRDESPSSSQPEANRSAPLLRLRTSKSIPKLRLSKSIPKIVDRAKSFLKSDKTNEPLPGNSAQKSSVLSDKSLPAEQAKAEEKLAADPGLAEAYEQVTQDRLNFERVLKEKYPGFDPDTWRSQSEANPLSQIGMDAERKSGLAPGGSLSRGREDVAARRRAIQASRQQSRSRSRSRDEQQDRENGGNDQGGLGH